MQSFTARDSLVFGTTGEAGASQDYLIFPNGPLAANQSSMYAASAFTDPGDVNDIDSRNHPHNYYSGFGGDSPPAAQMALFPQQNGATLVGATAFAWRDVLIQKRGDIVTWKLDGVLIGTVDASALANPLGGSNFFMGQTDINAGSSADPNVRSLLFGLFDNVSVEAVPEPTSLVLLGLCAVGACLARKRD